MFSGISALYSSTPLASPAGLTVVPSIELLGRPSPFGEKRICSLAPTASAFSPSLLPEASVKGVFSFRAVMLSCFPEL